MLRNRPTPFRLLSTAIICLCMPSAFAAEAQFGLAHQLFVVDHSGSMHGRYTWVNDIAVALQHNEKVSTQFGLMEFSETARPIALRGKQFGQAQSLKNALRKLKTSGAKEDGHHAVQQALATYSLTRRVAPHLILITDEHRSMIDSATNASLLADTLAADQIPLTAIVNVAFLCDDKQRALGMDARGLGIVMDQSGQVSSCTIDKLIEPGQSHHSISDYVDLALSTGGSAWDINMPRSGPERSAIFAQAFAQVHGAKVVQQLAHVDLIPRVSYAPDNPKVGDVITFDASNSRAQGTDNYVTGWTWDFNTDRTIDMQGGTVAHAFTTPGVYTVTVHLSTRNSSAPVSHAFQIKVSE